MDCKQKQQWTVEETSCLLAIWSSSEVQKKLEGASRTKPVFEDIQREIAAAGYDRTPLQITNKLKKLKMEYREQKRDLGRSGNARTRTGPHFKLLDSILGDRPACQLTGALNSGTAMLEATEEETLLPQTSTDPDFSFSDVDALAVETLACSSPEPSTSSAAASSHQARRVKRKRPQDDDVMQHLERMDDRVMQHNEQLAQQQNQLVQQQMQQQNQLMLQQMEQHSQLVQQQMEQNSQLMRENSQLVQQTNQLMRESDREHNSRLDSLLGIMSRMAGVFEAEGKK